MYMHVFCRCPRVSCHNDNELPHDHTHNTDFYYAIKPKGATNSLMLGQSILIRSLHPLEAHFRLVPR